MKQALRAVGFCAVVLAATAAGAGSGDAVGPWPPDPASYAPIGTPVAPGLAVGDVLGPENAARAAGLLPPEVLRHYEAGEYRNAIASWPDGIVRRSRAFDRASAANAGRYALDPRTGSIVDATTGAAVENLYGLPFPDIRPDDPDGGLKAVWNQFHAYWNAGSHHLHSTVVWARTRGLERQARLETFYQFYDNQEEGYRIPDPGEFTVQALVIVRSPADLQGTVSLSYRYRDPDRQDSLWTYVPALRRVRVVSASNRSDGMLGTDISLDDGNFFDAKPEDFTWRTLGLREGLRFADRRSVRGEIPAPQWTGNGWMPVVDSLTVAGFQDPGWRGSGWAPLDAVLVKRKFWVAEATPRDPDYLYGRIELWIDAETWLGAWSRKFSWKGEIAATFQLAGAVPTPATGPAGVQPEWVTNDPAPWQCMEAVPLSRATLAGLNTDARELRAFRVRLPVDEIFDLQTLTRLGR